MIAFVVRYLEFTDIDPNEQDPLDFSATFGREFFGQYMTIELVFTTLRLCSSLVLFGLVISGKLHQPFSYDSSMNLRNPLIPNDYYSTDSTGEEASCDSDGINVLVQRRKEKLKELSRLFGLPKIRIKIDVVCIGGKNSSYKVIVLKDNEVYKKIERTYTNFVRLETKLRREAENSWEKYSHVAMRLPSIQNREFGVDESMLDRYQIIQTRLRALTKFVNEVCDSIEFLTPDVLKFLKVDSETTEKIGSIRARILRDVEMDHYNSLSSEDSLNTSSPGYSHTYKRSSKSWTGISHKTNSELSDFFDITMCSWKVQRARVDRVQYLFKVYITKTDDMLTVRKSYSDFVTFHESIRKNVGSKAHVPTLPRPLRHVMEHYLNEHASLLKFYLSGIINDELYHCRAVFDFLTISETSFFAKHLMAIWKNNKSMTTSFRYTCHIPLFDTKLEHRGKKPFTVYQLEINVFDRVNGVRMVEGRVFKRYKQFETIHNLLESRFDKDKVPELPPKSLNPLNRTPPEERQVALEGYMNKVLQIPGVFSCRGFREWLELTPDDVN
mmetsp:Transcript_10839/g.11842  ORF Transcript_10839/g.11842 Transcript_10839/m.11842 type:complete len:554 (+) Transcript_10839:2-1663(+)